MSLLFLCLTNKIIICSTTCQARSTHKDYKHSHYIKATVFFKEILYFSTPTAINTDITIFQTIDLRKNIQTQSKQLAQKNINSKITN